MSVVGLIVVVFYVFLCPGFRSSLSPLLCFIALVIIVPVSIFYKSIAGRNRPVRVADGPITARYNLIKNASWVYVFHCDVLQMR